MDYPNMNYQNFDELLKKVKNISERLSGPPIFMGRIASYLYLQESPIKEDIIQNVDMFIGYDDYYTLDDIYGPFKINHPSKSMKMIINQVDLNVYLEDQGDLIYSYRDILKFSKTLDGITIPATEHLVALKLKASINQTSSNLSQKDKADIIKLLSISSKDINKEILSDRKFPLEELASFIDEVRKDNSLICEIALDFQQAELLKKDLEHYFEIVQKINLEKRSDDSIPLVIEEGEIIKTNRVFSSQVVFKDMLRRYARDRSNIHNTEDFGIISQEEFNKFSHLTCLTVEKLFELAKVPYRLFKNYEGEKVILAPNEDRNYRFVYDRSDYFIVGTKTLKRDNLLIRIIEQLAYNIGTYEASESAKRNSLFYNEPPLFAIERMIKSGEYQLYELEDLETGEKNLYYRHEPKGEFYRKMEHVRANREFYLAKGKASQTK